MIAFLRKLRHGPLSFLSSVWIVQGRVYRFLVSRFRWISVAHKIGKYGPFKMDAEFAFSDFEHWGRGHNNGFQVCVEAARSAKCFLDVGGHIGLVTMPVASVISTVGVVHTFEPAEANLRHLKSHIRRNNLENVIITESLVGDVDMDAVEFYEQPNATGQNALAVKKDHHKYKQTVRKQITLDSYCADNGLSPDVIKIDVEGAEWFVLNGARRILNQSKPVIFLSLHPAELKLLEKDVDAVVALIDELGYGIYEIDGSDVFEYRLAEYLLLPNEGKEQ